MTIPETIKICGVPYKVTVCPDNFDMDGHFGQINYITGEIRINEKCSPELQEETLCHEWLHGALVQLGFNDESGDEHLVTALANAIYQTFTLREEQDHENQIHRDQRKQMSTDNDGHGDRGHRAGTPGQ